MISTKSLVLDLLCSLSMVGMTRGGHELGGSDIGQNCCSSIEIKFTNNPSVNHPLIGAGRAGRLGGLGGWISSGLVGFNWACKCFLIPQYINHKLLYIGALVVQKKKKNQNQNQNTNYERERERE